MYHGDLAALVALLLSGRRNATRLIWSIRCSDVDLSLYGRGLRVVVGLCKRLSSWPIGSSRVLRVAVEPMA